MSRPAILVTDAQAVGMIAVIRSLGRAGYRVHAVSARPQALGLFSRYAAESACHPPYGGDAFPAWLDGYVQAHNIEAIVPSEGFLHALGERYERYAGLLPDAVAHAVWRRCMSKVQTQRCLQGAGEELCAHLPPGGLIEDEASLPTLAELAQVPAPYYLKADVGQARGEAEAVVRRCPDAASLLRAARELLPRYGALLWQGHAGGRKVGVSLWRHRGEFLAENMSLGLHTQPHTGGMMSLRQSFWHEALLADAKRKLAALGWQGVAMMEYQWDPASDRFAFIEINARYWGYLHLDLYSGKDFPSLQLDGFFGNPRTALGPAPRQVQCRHTVPGEIGYVLSRLRDPRLPLHAKLASLSGFFLRFLHPTERSDLLFPGDRGLYWRAWRQYLRQLA